LEAVPEAAVLKLGMTWPLPMDAIRQFVAGVKRAIVVEEGSRFLEENILAAGIEIERKDEVFEYSELNVSRVKKLVAHDTTPDAQGAPGRPPALCPGCPHRKTYEVLRDLGCIVAGDIGCYTLGVLPPFEALDCSICMGASIGAGLGLRHSLPADQAKKVVSVIGDSTFLHSGVTGILEMGYNKPATGHVVLILDNSTTAMTGLQEHAATGVHLDKTEAPKVSLEALCRAAGADNVDVINQVQDTEGFRALLQERLASNDVSVIIAQSPCILQLKKLAKQKKG
jgi:indolepyruvate ferredoxin oxidoreductase alpha subunit